MRRTLITFCAVASLLVLQAYAGSTGNTCATYVTNGGSKSDPTTPPDYCLAWPQGPDESMCMIAATTSDNVTPGLTFSNGLTLTPAFSPTVFHYTCSCTDPTFYAGFSTRPTILLQDGGSSAEVNVNGVWINDRVPDGNAISNDGTVAGSGLIQVGSSFSLKGGMNTISIGVGCNGEGTPYTCYYQYNISCNVPPSQGGFVVGDPQFVGLRGQNYQVHGVSGEIYNIVSDADLQYNSRFVFLNGGECPVLNGRKQKGCWSHPGSYLGELGLKTRSGDRIHIVSGDAKTGFATVEVNGKALAIGDSVLLADNMGSLTLNSTHVTSVSIGNWEFAFENSDMFVNQRVRVLDSRGLRSHGLLGQTWRDTTYANAVKHVQGQVDDYVIRDGDIFGDNFVYNTFN